MPHPTPYSREFDAIRQAFPGVFDRSGELPETESTDTGIAASDLHTTKVIHFYARHRRRIDRE